MNRRSQPYRQNSRRGVALLFVISLIVVFFLFATTFVAMSTSYMRTSDRKLRIERTEQLKVSNVADDVFYMLLRDVATGHILRGHSLLADQYGVEPFASNDGGGAFTGTCDLVAVDNGYSNQVLRVQLTASNQPGANATSIAALIRASRDDFMGRFLTFSDGPLAGVTMPILEYKFRLLGPNPIVEPNNVECHFFVLVQQQERSWSFGTDQIAQMNGARFVINGRPFDGTTTESNETYDIVSDDLGALLQNRNFFLARDARSAQAFPEQYRQVPSFHRYAGFSGVTIDPAVTTWQALRNAARTALRPSPLENPNFTGSNPNSRFFVPGTYADPARVPNSTFPTATYFGENGFNSAALEHWRHLLHGLLGNNPAVLNQLNLALNSGLDVDTDGDGVNDAIWIDIGLPPVAMPNGTRVKPLVAIKIIDMDGRLNLNAVGSIAELLRSANPLAANGVPYGQGYGPADIPLSSVIGAGNLQLVLQSRYGLPTGGRPSGAPDHLGYTNPLHAARWFGFLDNVLPSLTGGIYSSPSDYQNQFVFQPTGTSVQPGYVVPPGSPGMTLPFAQTGGTLLTQMVDTPYEFNLFAEGSPYIYFNYANGTRFQAPPGNPDVDQPFNETDLEALLRAHDSDFAQLLTAAMNLRSDASVTLPLQNRRQIIQNLLTSFASNENVRNQLTTRSFEVPAIPSNLAGVLRRHLLARDLSGATNQINASISHFQPNGALLTPAATDVVRAVEQQVMAMLGQEIVAGLPFNLHRRFGNGIDDNGTFTLDDHGDPSLGGGVESGRAQTSATINALASTAIDLDFDNDGNVPSQTDGDQYLARSTFARQLYVLMLMMVEPNYATTTSFMNTPPGRETLRRRIAIAQWAINAVDFMDADSTCTPFEFDINPFNGWHVDGALGSRPNGSGGIEAGIENPVIDPLDGSGLPQHERRVVWGLERPDVLLTEAVGFHEHRTHIVGSNALQGHMPNPSAFIELYNPQLVPDSDHQSQADTHASLSPTEKGVNLRKTTPMGEPVYRMLVVKEQDRGLNPDYLVSDFDRMSQDHVVNGTQRRFAQAGVGDIERTVYFVNPSNLVTKVNQYIADNAINMTNDDLRVQLALGTVQHFPSSLPGATPFVLQPGHHAIVGSAGPHAQFAATRNMTIFGRIAGAPVDNSYDPAVHSVDRPAIRLNPGLPIESGLFDPSNAAKMRIVPNTIGIPLDQVNPAAPEYRSFAVSGPISGYPQLDTSGDPPVAEEDGWRYETVFTTPFYDNIDQDYAKYGEITDINDNDPDSPRSIRHVVLQRLANPEQQFHPVLNPYLTLDDIAVTLNGTGGLGIDPDLQNNVAGVPGNGSMVCSSQRGKLNANPTTFAHGTNPALVNQVERKNVWLRTASGEWEVTTIGGANGIVPADLTTFDSATLNYTNPTQMSLGVVNDAFRSQQNDAVPWLRIANRPFISQFELASVPVQSNSLLLEHVIWTDPRVHNHYVDDAFLNTASDANLRNVALFPDLMNRIPGYLLNFYGQTTAMRAPARLFEFTSVPSPFVGTDTFLNPRAKAAGGFGFDTSGVGGTTPGLMADGPRYGAPFGFLSNRRIPGKVNLSTINNEQTWNAVMGAPIYFNPTSNSQFGNVSTNNSFVGATHGQTPALPLRHSPWLQNAERFSGLASADTRLPASATGLPGERYYDTWSTLWGPVPGAGPARIPMYDYLPAGSNANYDPNRNEYFRMQKRQRMANTTTQRSSVFAVWITVGYFELEEVAIPVPNDPNAPLQNVNFSNGLVEWRTAIGREHGLDRGKVRRDRAFYLVDRSIPVGFFPGENLNVDQAVLTRKYLP
ncbi:MAG: hypothetical protein JNL67_22465 [Planctomycetaceae bacterium]|nr:hypothetical protein [Planctomycetaceae bacterium]